MALVYGIDFGTSNSAVMVGLPDGRVRRVRNPMESIYDVPSVVCMKPDDSIVVGTVAWRTRLQRPNWYRDEFKRDIGSSIPVVFPPERVGGMVGNRTFEVNYLVAQVLRLLREYAEREVPGDVDLVVITVPASWQAGNRGQMLRAAQIAGFDTSRIHLVKEPEAAVAYAVQEHLGLELRTLLVYDLGGGTFDCALVRGSTSSGYEVLGESGGLDNVGGVIFNSKILGLIRSRFPQEMARLFSGPGDDTAVLKDRLQIRDTCENAKRVLSTEQCFDGILPELGSDAEFVLTRVELAELIFPMLADTITECERLLGSLDMQWGDVDMVVPVGGSSRLPIVGETIARFSGKQYASVMRVEDPELAVVHGATLRALELAGSPAGGQPRVHTASPGTAGDQPPRMAPKVTGLRVPPFVVEPVTSPRAEPEVESVVSAPSPESTSRRRAAHAAAKPATTFPREGTTFAARQDAAIRQVRRWHRSTITIVCVAAALAIVNFFDIPSNTAPGHGITQGELTIAAYVLVGLGVAGFVITSRAMNSALKKWGEMVAAGIAIGCAAGVHYFLSGWLSWLLLAITLLAAAVIWIFAASEYIPQKAKFARYLHMNTSGFSLRFADGGMASFRWDQIESIAERSSAVKAVLSPEGWRAWNKSYQLSHNEQARTVELFERYHFMPERDVLAAIDFYSRRPLRKGS